MTAQAYQSKREGWQDLTVPAPPWTAQVIKQRAPSPSLRLGLCPGGAAPRMHGVAWEGAQALSLAGDSQGKVVGEAELLMSLLMSLPNIIPLKQTKLASAEKLTC